MACHISDIAYLVCFDRSAEPEFEEARNAALELIEVKTEGASKLTAFDRRNILATNVSIYSCYIIKLSRATHAWSYSHLWRL
jgi:hypothetical protein